MTVWDEFFSPLPDRRKNALNHALFQIAPNLNRRTGALTLEEVTALVVVVNRLIEAGVETPDASACLDELLALEIDRPLAELLAIAITKLNMEQLYLYDSSERLEACESANMATE